MTFAHDEDLIMHSLITKQFYNAMKEVVLEAVDKVSDKYTHKLRWLWYVCSRLAQIPYL